MPVPGIPLDEIFAYANSLRFAGFAIAASLVRKKDHARIEQFSSTPGLIVRCSMMSFHVIT